MSLFHAHSVSLQKLRYCQSDSHSEMSLTKGDEAVRCLICELGETSCKKMSMEFSMEVP